MVQFKDRWLVVILIFLICGITACKNPFSHRNSEDPVGSSGTFEFPTTPTVVITNLLFAYNERNINNFRQCFSDSFKFSAYEDSIEAEQRGQGYIFHNWDITVEEAVTRSIFQSFPSGLDSSYMRINIDLSSNEFDEETDSTATLLRSYEIAFIIQGDETADTTFAVGESMFKMSRSHLAGWIIDVWSDRPDEKFELDWADFKALFR